MMISVSSLTVKCLCQQGPSGPPGPKGARGGAGSPVSSPSKCEL